MHVTEMNILRWAGGVTDQDRIRNVFISEGRLKLQKNSIKCGRIACPVKSTMGKEEPTNNIRAELTAKSGLVVSGGRIEKKQGD